jgi:hypothetical protein
VFSVQAGTYTSVQTVAITDSTVGTQIYYTTNGTTPTTASTLYTGPLTVNASETVEAIAVETGYDPSAVGSAAYVINLPPNGKAYANQKALVGAHVYMLAAGTTGYGGAGLAASSTNASVSLLTATDTGLSDAVGAYVLTAADGSFVLDGDYSCTPGQQVYLYALGGSTGAGANTGIGLLAALGACPAAGNFGTSLYAVMNEVSTVATAYAFAGFATDATHVGSSGTALAKVGIANAFANATNLETLGTGVALATTPAGNGTVPQAEINTLANVLASCTSTSAAGSNGCALLFGDALSGGTTGGTPTDTATAAINIAHNPGVGVAALYGLATGTSPFAPGLSGQPNDFAVAIQITGGGGLGVPSGVAIDRLGNAWVTSEPPSSPFFDRVSEFSSSGTPLSPSGGYTAGGLSGGESLLVTIDLSGDVWVMSDNTNDSTSAGGLTELSDSGSVLQVLNASAFPANYLGCIGGLPSGMAIDGVGNVWVVSGENSCIVKLSSTGSILLQVDSYSGFSTPNSVAVDGSGNAWVANGRGWDAEFSSNGTPLSGTYGYQDSSIYGFDGIALDASGNAWTTYIQGLAGPFSLIEVSNDGAYTRCLTMVLTLVGPMVIRAAGCPSQ